MADGKRPNEHTSGRQGKGKVKAKGKATKKKGAQKPGKRSRQAGAEVNKQVDDQATSQTKELANAVEEEEIVVLDPWRKVKSAFGGKLSPHEEYRTVRDDAFTGPRQTIGAREAVPQLDAHGCLVITRTVLQAATQASRSEAGEAFACLQGVVRQARSPGVRQTAPWLQSLHEGDGGSEAVLPAGGQTEGRPGSLPSIGSPLPSPSQSPVSTFRASTSSRSSWTPLLPHPDTQGDFETQRNASLSRPSSAASSDLRLAKQSMSRCSSSDSSSGHMRNPSEHASSTRTQEEELDAGETDSQSHALMWKLDDAATASPEAHEYEAPSKLTIRGVPGLPSVNLHGTAVPACVSLEISACGLPTFLPPACLEFLRALDLSRNGLTSLPDLKTLSKLRLLDLSGNPIVSLSSVHTDFDAIPTSDSAAPCNVGVASDPHAHKQMGAHTGTGGEDATDGALPPTIVPAAMLSSSSHTSRTNTRHSFSSVASSGAAGASAEGDTASCLPPSLFEVRLRGTLLTTLGAIHNAHKEKGLRGADGGIPGSALCSVPNLQVLDVSCCRLQEPETLQIFDRATFPRLERLSFQHNPMEVSTRYAQVVSQTVRGISTLKELNGSNYSVSFSVSNECMSDFLQRSTEDTSIREGEKLESCSCIEGNPCAVPYHCLDWENRFEVAKKAREENYSRVF